MPSTKSVGMKWGLILGVLSIVWFLITVFAGLATETWAQWSGLVFTIVILYLAHKDFKDSGDGYMSYGQGLGIGMITIGISSVLSSAFAYVYIKFIDPTYMEMIMDKQIEGMQENGMSDAEIETAMSFSEGFMNPEVMFVTGIIWGLLLGFIISLIVSAITKNSNPELDM